MEAKVESTENKIIYATIKLLDKNSLTALQNIKLLPSMELVKSLFLESLKIKKISLK